MRLFIGVQPPDHVRRGIASFGSRLVEEYTLPGRCLVRTENLHATLKFLGEIPEKQLPELFLALGQCKNTPRFNVEVDRVECLPERGPVRIISAGLTGELDRLHGLFGEVESACQALNIPSERRAFRPHITFVRLRSPLPPYVRDRMGSMSFPPDATRRFEVNEFVLFQSHLEPQGARYVPLARFPLA